MPSTSKNQHFTYLLPPGWVRIDLRGDLEPQVEQVLTRHAERIPRDQQAKVRAFAGPRLLSGVREAAAGGAYDLVVPVPRQHYETISTFVVAPLAWPDGIDAIDGITAIAASDSSAQLAEIGGLVALRTQADVARADEGPVIQAARREGLEGDIPTVATSRRVQYFIGDPERPRDWITALFSIPLADNEQALEWVTAETELFDSVMKSLRFF